MAFDAKTATPDASVPDTGFLFGADSQSAATPSVYQIARIKEVEFAFDAANQNNSLAHLTGVAVGDTFRVKFWDSSRQDGSSALWRCWQTGSGTIGAISNGGASQGVAMQGNGARFLLVPQNGNRVDIRTCGVVCDGVATGQESRVETLRAAAQARGLTLTGAGTLRIARTLDLRFCSVDFEGLLIQAGTPVDSGTAGGQRGDFYTAQGQNIQVASISRANPGVVTTTAAHGLANDTMIMFGVSGLGSLPHELETLEPYYVRNATATTFELSATAGGASIDTTATSVEINLEGTAFVFVPPAANANFQTEDIIGWDGRVTRYAYAVLMAGDGPVNAGICQRVKVRGDGNFNYTTRSTLIAAELQGDDSPHGEFVIKGTYVACVAALTGAFEKKKCHIHGTYVELGHYLPKNTSADTVDIYSQLTKYRAGHWEYDGVSSSINVHALWESRDDPGDDSPSHWVRSGKSGSISGVSRAHNGLRLSLIDKPKQFGQDAFRYDDFGTIDTYGNVIDIRRCRRVAGNVTVYDSKKGPTSGGTDNAPAVRVSRVVDAAHLVVTGHNIANTYGVEIGDGTLYSRDANLGSYAIQMGNLTPIADTNIDANGFPSGVTAIRVRSIKGGSMRIAACIGDIVVESGVQEESGRPFRMEIPRHQNRYTRTVDPLAKVEIGFAALLQASDGKLPSSVLPQNVVAGVGASANYNATTGLTTVAFTGEFGSSAAGWNETVLPADFSMSSNVQANVTGLKFTPAANKRYIVEGWIAHTANASGTGVRVGITTPAGLTCGAVQILSANGSASSQANNNTVAVGNTASTAANSTGAIANLSFIRAIIIAGASPSGDVQITVASEVDANQVTVLSGSILRWRDIG